MIAVPARAAFLRKIHLFHDLKDEQLVPIAEKLKEEAFEAGKKVFAQGSDATRFYLIYDGSVEITQARGRETLDLAALVEGDYFGEESLLANKKRSATVSTLETAVLLSLARGDFNALLKSFPKLRPAFEISMESRRLARRLRFDWLAEGEVVYFVARKHEVLLARALSGPLLAMSLPVGLFIGFILTNSFSLLVFAALLTLAILGWGAWNALDWSNDYYIVTNHRVIWLEKVIGLYDSRQEAPLTTVLSVGVETDITGRLLDYGNVVIRTFVGKIPFSHVSHPYQAAHMVEEQWTRTKHFTSSAEKDAMKNTLRLKLGLTAQTPAAETTRPPEKQSLPTIYKPTLWSVVTANWFKLRTEDGGTITYRKHWYVLWRQAWQPTVLILLVLVGMLTRLITLFRTPGPRLFDFSSGIRIDTVMAALPFLLVPLIGWLIYEYIDWSNDIFQVTNDQILDIDRAPFGTEERRAAPLENILSTEYERRGLTGYLLNFGTVHITVGGTKLSFEDVLDPAAVQSDIDRRRTTRVAKKKEAEAVLERERMADWLAMYHESSDEFRKQNDQPDGEAKSG